jgi:uncharacterized protein YdhG (YjbR/CyaY superfamily)
MEDAAPTTTASAPADIDEYIAAFPQRVQDLLQSVRRTIAAAAPEARESISYRIPTFTLNGPLVHFAAFKGHVGLYPGAAAIRAFKDELAGFHAATGTIRFPFDAPLPLPLVARIVRWRADAKLQRASSKLRRREKPRP